MYKYMGVHELCYNQKWHQKMNRHLMWSTSLVVTFPCMILFSISKNVRNWTKILRRTTYVTFHVFTGVIIDYMYLETDLKYVVILWNNTISCLCWWLDWLSDFVFAPKKHQISQRIISWAMMKRRCINVRRHVAWYAWWIQSSGVHIMLCAVRIKTVVILISPVFACPPQTRAQHTHTQPPVACASEPPASAVCH